MMSLEFFLIQVEGIAEGQWVSYAAQIVKSLEANSDLWFWAVKNQIWLDLKSFYTTSHSPSRPLVKVSVFPGSKLNRWLDAWVVSELLLFPRSSEFVCCRTPIHPLTLIPPPFSCSTVRQNCWSSVRGTQHGTASQTTAPLWCVSFMGEESLMGWAFLCLHHRHHRLPLWPNWHLSFSIRWPKVGWAQPAGMRCARCVWERDCTCKSFTVPARGSLERGQSQRAALYTELHVTPLRMGNMELANV